MIRSKKLKSLILIALTIPISLFGITGTAEAYTTQNVLGSGKYSTNTLSVSTDGRYVAFISSTSTLVSPDTNNNADAFLKDTKTGTVSLLSITPSGDSGNAPTSNNVIITGNGRYALFSSEASNLSSVAGEYGRKNLYLRDVHNSTTTLIAKGSHGSGINYYAYGISEDGRFIYYSSSTYGLQVYDRTLNTTDKVDRNDIGVPGNYGSSGASNVMQKQVSCDGRFVVLGSSSTNLVSNDVNGVHDIFLVDRMAGHSVKNITQNANGTNWQAKISCDGNYVLFESAASNLVSSDTNNSEDLFKYNVSTGAIEIVSLKDDESQYAGRSTLDSGIGSSWFDMSMDGRYVFFERQQRVSGNDRNYLSMRDTELGTTVDIAGSGSNYFPSNPIASYDGRKVYYVYRDSLNNGWYTLNLVTGHF